MCQRLVCKSVRLA